MVEYGRLGERQRRLQVPWLELFSALLLFVAFLWGLFELVNYSNTKDSLQTDLTIAGIPVGGMAENEAQTRLESIYMGQPVQLYYEGSTIMLDPQVVGFRINSDAMLAEARAQNSREKNFWAGFWNYLWRRPVAAVSVPLDAEYSESDLRLYLEDLAARYDAAPGGAGLDMATLTFRSGIAGRQLDLDGAMELIVPALFDPLPENRRVLLPTEEVSAGQQDESALQQAILDLMQQRGFDYNGELTKAAVYVLNLDTGEEVTLQADMAYSGVSTIKIPIMINLFRSKLTMDIDSAYLLTQSILCSNNSSSNLLMQITGVGNDVNSMLGDGLRQVSCTAQELGAEHTYISAPLDVGDQGPRGEWPVCRPETPAPASIADDPWSQTTPADMGLLLTHIYDCANYGSGLLTVYPYDFTQTECTQMIEVMSGNRIDRLMELGIPLGTRIAHKNGWGPQTSGDAGIVYSPGATYIFVMYTWEADTDNNGVPTLASWELIEEASRLVYNYFNPAAPMFERRDPILPTTAIDCVTVDPTHPEYVDLNNINANRIDENGNPVSGACYGGHGHCRPFDNWGAGQTAEQ
ncbi:MAG: serine hydrolase [Chloroflexi bacterium]|nr:serine hydrolase [Chloroflexota bacterium]